jgi:hypothetical protein
LSLGQHRKYPLVVAANRDELLARPTQAAGFWQDAPQLLAGRDLSQGGTWLGITRDGRFAALTNFRDPPAKRPDRPSRGYLISAFLQGSDTPSAYVTGLAARAHEYNGFSLIVGHGGEFYYYANREREPRALAPGLYGLSNHLLDTPWPKVVRGKPARSSSLPFWPTAHRPMKQSFPMRFWAVSGSSGCPRSSSAAAIMARAHPRYCGSTTMVRSPLLSVRFKAAPSATAPSSTAFASTMENSGGQRNKTMIEP